MKPTYQDDYTDQFWRGVGKDLQKEVVEEYNRRLSDGGSLRFTFLDDAGEKIWELLAPLIRQSRRCFFKML